MVSLGNNGHCTFTLAHLHWSRPSYIKSHYFMNVNKVRFMLLFEKEEDLVDKRATLGIA